ncbi:MAG: DUF4838 domain-containing protein [Bacteroidota bacterium]
MMKKIIIFFLVFGALETMAQDAMFGIGGQMFQISGYRIVVPLRASEVELKAASELQKYLGRVTGVIPGIENDQGPRSSREILIGHSLHFPASADSPALDPDGFEITIQRPWIMIAGGSHKGVLYGVYEFVEKHLGCRFWAPGAETIPQKSLIMLPVIHTVANPAFGSREVYYAGMDDQDFTDKMRCDRHAWKGGENWGMWVHTMFSLVPPGKYFETHPEYYALMGGKRTKTQLCLSNPDVLQITIEELKRRMKEKPQAKYWSVSQMDTYGYCECDGCRGTMPGPVSPSDCMIAFVNKVAAAFPGKVISTLAYQYTRSAPKNVKPASNVNIMLCTIECDRSKPLDSDTSAGSFAADLRDWSAISKDILVWDYVIQFTNMIAPFPNLPVLQSNIQLFKKYNAGSVFEQGCHGTYSENQELRQYLLAKLLWNPGLNTDSLINLFLTGYYGPAAPFIRHYLSGMESALQQSGKTLWIYSSPMQETGAFLGPVQIAGYNRDFESAMSAAAGDSALSGRVAKARLPLQYSILEIAKKNITGQDGFLEPSGAAMAVRRDRMDQLAEFVRLANLYGVMTVHERGLSPDEYGNQTALFFQKAYTNHLAKDKPYTLATAPAEKYSAEGMGSLTDGKRGSANYNVLWQGFEGADLCAVVDLGKETAIGYVGAEFLQDLASWIFYPEKLTISISPDGKNYLQAAVFDSLSFSDPLLIRETGRVIPPAKARYVRFEARNKGKCPAWHIGHGGKAWLFADELIVD